MNHVELGIFSLLHTYTVKVKIWSLSCISSNSKLCESKFFFSKPRNEATSSMKVQLFPHLLFSHQHWFCCCYLFNYFGAKSPCRCFVKRINFLSCGGMMAWWFSCTERKRVCFRTLAPFSPLAPGNPGKPLEPCQQERQISRRGDTETREELCDLVHA